MKTTVLGLLLLAAPVAYALRMLQFRRAWNSPPRPLTQEKKLEKANSQQPTATSSGALHPQLSVLIAARNEAANLPNLLADLQRQTLSPVAFEVIVIDDHSTDATAAIVTEAARTSAVQLRLLQLANLPDPARSGKKAALEAAIAVAQAPWIVCTDADCRVQPNWLAAHQQAHDPDAQFVSGPVLLTGQGALAALQGLELVGLVGSGAAGILLGAPTMCNGANLSYRRASFHAVGGYTGNAQVASGDDEFLLHKLHAMFPAGIRFLQDPQATVRTAAQPTLRQLLRQRVRWASKWQHYQAAAPQQLAVLVLAANVALAGGAVAMLVQPILASWVVVGWTMKLGADVLFLTPVLQFFRRRRWLVWVPVLQLAYAPYALLVGLAGLRGGYEWKGRQLR
ncbi:glycosyltransferase [Hymenobacter norwichensis]|uniref:glycosyltransferase n=1 Tax=Hymenobacter norwichensis TaxID=223903 RepID=UPI0003B75FBE|nr:glycosyltransferase [Hymenobacter norwichensis]